MRMIRRLSTKNIITCFVTPARLIHLMPYSASTDSEKIFVEAMYDDFGRLTKSLNSINPDFPFTLKKRTEEPRPRPKSAGGSDHAYFAMNGVPTLRFDEQDVKGYNFSYGEIWHTERDTYDKSIAEYQEHTSVVTAVIVYGLANLDHLLSREGLYADE